MSSFEGKVAVVTGAARGMGREIALSLARRGARVVLADVVEEEGEAAAAACRDLGAQAVFKATDVSREDAVETMVAMAVERFGRLDLACNNAGIEGPVGNLADLERKDFDRVLAIDLTGVWLGMKHQIRQFLAQGDGGAIVNISSIMGLVGATGIAAYTAAKHGVIGLTKSAALEYATDGIRVNAICPGGIRTAILERAQQNNPEKIQGFIAATPMGHFGEPGDIAAAVLWLLSGESRYVTGHAMAVDGGFLAQ